MKKIIYKLTFLTTLFSLFYTCDDVERVYYNDSAETVLELSDNNLVLVEGRELDEFIYSISSLGLKLKKIKEIGGFNYSKGQNVKILFFKVAK